MIQSPSSLPAISCASLDGGSRDGHISAWFLLNQLDVKRFNSLALDVDKSTTSPILTWCCDAIGRGKTRVSHARMLLVDILHTCQNEREIHDIARERKKRTP
jgi:hypothetical protein